MSECWSQLRRLWREWRDRREYDAAVLVVKIEAKWLR